MDKTISNTVSNTVSNTASNTVFNTVYKTAPKVLSFVKLDLITVKPYLTLKNFLIFAVMAFFLLLNTDTPAASIGILMAYAALYISYPFVISERNGMDALYATLAINRRTVVRGRYLFALLTNVCAGLFSWLLSSGIMAALGKEVHVGQSLLITLSILLAFSVIQAIQLPIYFNLGYGKAKLLVYLPFLVIPLTVLLLGNALQKCMDFIGFDSHTALFDPESMSRSLVWLAEHPQLVIIMVAVVWVFIMLVSIRMSEAFYRKRDF